MPFVSETGQVALPKKGYAAQLGIEENDPSIAEIAGAFWRQENIIGSIINEEPYLPDEKTTDFDPFNVLTETELLDSEFMNYVGSADNQQEVESVRKQVNRERADKQTISDAGALGFIVGLPVMIADPISLLTIGGAIKNTYKVGNSILRNGAVTGSLVAAETAIQEAALHTSQLTRTYGESAVNITGAMLLGGTLGAVFNKANGDINLLAKEAEDAMNPEGKIANNINPATNEPATLSVGAAQVDDIGSAEVIGAIPKAITKVMGKFDPLSSNITSPSKATRQITALLVENPTMVDTAPLTSVESKIKIRVGPVMDSLQNQTNLFKQYQESQNAGIKDKIFSAKSEKEFAMEVSRAVRTGDSKIPEAKQAADFWNKSLYHPIRDEMIALNMLPEGVTVKTANNYLNRLWNKDSINANFNKFTTVVADWLARQDLDLVKKADFARSALKNGVDDPKLKKQYEETIKKATFKEDVLGPQTEKSYRMLAGEIATRITGTPDGRLPYDWQIGNGSKNSIDSNGNMKFRGTGIKGPLKERVFDIPDDLVEDFLENDIRILGQRFYQGTVPDIEIFKQFNDVSMTSEIKAIRDEAQDFIDVNELKGKEGLKVIDQMNKDIKNLSGMRDRMRNIYGFQENNMFVRSMRAARNLNYLRLLGGVTPSSLPDFARVAMAEGFGSTFNTSLKALTSAKKVTAAIREELRLWGIGTDYIANGKSELIADIADYTQGGSMFERGLQTAAAKYGRYNALDYWTAGMKQLHGMTMQTRIFDKLEKGIYDKKLGRLGISEPDAKAMWEQVKLYGKREDGLWISGAKNWDRPDLERMYGAAMRKESDRVVIIPGQEKPLFMSEPLGQTFLQFKSFILSATQRILVAGLQKQDEDQMMGLLGLIGAGTMTYFIKQSISGKEISDDPKVWVMEGIDRSGAIGIIGEIDNVLTKMSSNNFGLRALFGIDAINMKQANRTVAEGLLGPTFGSLLSTVVAANNAITSGDPLTEADVRALRRLLPYQNLFFLRRGFDEVQKSITE